MKIRRAAILPILFCCVLVVLCLRPGIPRGVSPSVLLITVDSLRPDHLGCYGYARKTSPFIDKLAREGIVFTQAIAQASWTLPSMAGIETSAYPSTHQVYAWDTALPPKLTTIAQVLKRRGYRTFFCSGHNRALSRIIASGKGYEKWSENDDVELSSGVTAEALRFLKENRGKRFYLRIHYMDTHERMFVKHARKGSDNASIQKAAIIHEYDAAIAKVDRQINAIVSELERSGADRNTLIIISADHGEELCERSVCFNHGGFLWDTLVHVPLIIVWRGHFPPNRKISSQVRHIDIAATVCDVVGAGKPRYFEGFSLLPEIKSGGGSSRTAFGEHREYKEDSIRGRWEYSKVFLRTPLWKLIYTVSPGGEAYELYDLKNDAAELNNLSETNKKQCGMLKQELKSWMNRPKPDIPASAIPINNKDKARLKSLGYLQ